uniref:Uncharacterized protein n=1 Tax=Rhizophora mucronata TaxID=61149 RepID=A0A2P2QKL6_RHIMU
MGLAEWLELGKIWDSISTKYQLERCLLS